MAKLSESTDQDEVLGHLLGIRRNRTFNELSTEEKEKVGSQLQSVLNDVSSGALMPLMHYTLSAEHIRKLANIKNIIQSVVKEHLGINDEIPFTSMSKVEKQEVGSRLSALLKDISGGALFPLLNSALNSGEVEKLVLSQDGGP